MRETEPPAASPRVFLGEVHGSWDTHYYLLPPGDVWAFYPPNHGRSRSYWERVKPAYLSDLKVGDKTLDQLIRERQVSPAGDADPPSA